MSKHTPRALFLALFGAILCLHPGLLEAAKPCGGENQRACCAFEKKFGACKSGLTAVLKGKSEKCGKKSIFKTKQKCVKITPCGDLGQRACCLLEKKYRCKSGLTQSPKKNAGWCKGGLFQSSSTCVKLKPCGALNQRACCLGEKKFGACKSGLVPVRKGNAEKCGKGSLVSTKKKCLKLTPCGAAGQRACCIGEKKHRCQSGLAEVPKKNAGWCKGGIAQSSSRCVQTTPCGKLNQRACCVGETSFGACGVGLKEKAQKNSGYCGNGKLGIQSNGICVKSAGCGGPGRSKVIVHNNTPFTMTLQTARTGTPLADAHWGPKGAALKAYERKEILCFARLKPIKKNKNYYFTTTVGLNGSTMTIKQRLKGKTIGSSMWQGAGSSGWHRGRRWKKMAWNTSASKIQIKYRATLGTIRYTFTAPDEPLFAMPVMHRSRITIGIPGITLMGGPFGVDGAEGERKRGLTCKNYDDKGGLVGPPFCYGGHRGTDFMLKGSFRQMDKAKNYVVAARAGKVIYVRDHLYDRCKSKFYSKDAKSLLQPDCGGRNKVDGSNFASNKIVIDHGGGILSWYVHLKKNSSLVKVGDWVKCRQKIGEIGSSGMSTKPHLHFEVKVNGRYNALTKDSNGAFVNSTGIWGDVVDPYKGRLTQRGYWVNQGSTRLPNNTCAANQPQGPVAAVAVPLTATVVQTRCKPGYKLIGGKCQRLDVSVRKCKPGHRLVRGKCLLKVARPAITAAISKVKVAKARPKVVVKRTNLCRVKAWARVKIRGKLRRVQVQRVKGKRALVSYRDGRRPRTSWVACRSLRK